MAELLLTSEEQARLAHLWRRLGFGVSPQEWSQGLQISLDESVAALLSPQSQTDNLAALIAQIGDDFIDYDNLDSVRQLWLYRMVHSRRPLEERMTLFWHSHFACANYKVNSSRLMWRQIELFRTLGLGSFRTLLQAVTSDPAMLVWLDGAQNRNVAPNENYARECMELFTMGVGNGYDENDVKAAARSFTGWTLSNGTATFAPYLHDDGEKIYLGKTGNFYSDDAIDIICAHPSTARFICARLWRHLVGTEPTAAELQPATTAFTRSGYHIGHTIETIVHAPTFFAPPARFVRIKSPTELVVGHMRLLDAPLTSVRDLYRDFSNMGQELLNPPNVKGWPEGRQWINARTLLARINCVRTLTQEMARRDSFSANLKPLLASDITSPQTAAQVLWNGVMPGLAIPPVVNAEMVKHLQTTTRRGVATEMLQIQFDARLGSLLEIVTGAPEYQLA